jgi:plasmid stabilization system protein ParE
MQTYKIVVSELAKTDLLNIVAYISDAESLVQAKYVERCLLSEIKRLKCFPNAYPKDEYASMDNKEVRFVVKWHYKILFFIDTNTVHIVGIFHTAQDPNKLIYTVVP